MPSHVPSQPFPQLLPVRERARVVNAILQQRFDNILPAVMTETGIDLWLVICHEDNYDPIFKTITPWQCWAPILQMVVFYQPAPGQPVERINLSRTNMFGLMSDGWDPNSSESQWAALRRVIEARNPRQIAINESPTIWAADGLTVSLKAQLVETLGPTLAARLTSAEPVAIRWLETRLPAELELYQQAAKIAHALIRECFSRAVITPGITTIEDLRWHWWQRSTDMGLPVSFPPFFLRIRSDASSARWGATDPMIRAGDLLHCDVGVEYLRLLTDHQELAYVLRPGESAPPQSLVDGMAAGNRLQEIFTGSWQQGATGNQILRTALDRAHAAGIPNPRIYSHSLSHFLHEPGPLMGLPWEQESCPGRGDVVMHYNTVYTVELSVTVPVAEWDGQLVRLMLEQDAAFTADGVVYMDGRQQAFHLI